MRFLYATTLMNFVLAATIAAPPRLEIPQEIQASGEYVSFVPDTDAINVAYIAQSGVEPFPSGMLRDQRAFLLPVRGLKDGKYGFVAVGVKGDEYTRRDFVIVVGKVVVPPIPPKPPIPPTPPKPKPEPPKPVPKVDSAPTKTDGLYVLFVYETGQRVTQAQFNVMYGLKVRSWLDVNTEQEGKQPQYRLIDQNQVPTTEPWVSALKRNRISLPWVVIMSGKQFVHEQPLSLTGTEDEFIDILKKYKPNAKTPECPDGKCPIAPIPRPK
jgi:hypothetical protein